MKMVQKFLKKGFRTVIKFTQKSSHDYDLYNFSYTHKAPLTNGEITQMSVNKVIQPSKDGSQKDEKICIIC